MSNKIGIEKQEAFTETSHFSGKLIYNLDNLSRWTPSGIPKITESVPKKPGCLKSINCAW